MMIGVCMVTCDKSVPLDIKPYFIKTSRNRLQLWFLNILLLYLIRSVIVVQWLECYTRGRQVKGLNLT